MRKKTLTLVVLIIGATFAPAPLLATDMRCGTNLVGPGDTEYKVVSACGEPTFRRGNVWFYDRGSTFFVKEIHFMGGKVSRIKNTENAMW